MLIDVIRGLFNGSKVSFAGVLMMIAAALFIIFCILPLHEFAHAWAADKLGDNTARYQGRLTMNPLASFDPLGAMFLLLFGFGWAKPVPIDSRNFKNPRSGMALTALAGPLSNLLAAWAGGIVYYGILIATGRNVPFFAQIFFLSYIQINVALAVFNLIPLPPLDGSKILGAFLPARTLYKYYQYQRIIVLVAFFVLFTGILNTPLLALESLAYTAVDKISALPYQLLGLL